MSKRRGALAAFGVGALSIAATLLVRRRGERNRPHVDLYFEDGSMVSLPESSPQAQPLLELGRDAVEAARAT